MKTLLNVQRIRRVGIAAVLLAIASVSLSAGSAQALPNDRCQSYLHMMDVTQGLENRAYALYQSYEAAGDYQTAAGYEAEFHICGSTGTTTQGADSRHGACRRSVRQVSAGRC